MNKIKPYILKTIKSKSGTIVESYINIIESLDDLEDIIDENRNPSESNYSKQELIEKISDGQDVKDIINWALSTYVTFKKLSPNELVPERKKLESSLQASINFFESQIDHIQEVIYLNKKENV